MAVPDFQTLMLPVLKLAAAGETRVIDCVGKIAAEFGLNEADIAELLPSGKQTRLKNRIYWAKSYLGQAGLVESTKRGLFQVTAAGRKVLESGVAKIDKSYLERFPSYREFMARSAQDETDAPSSTVSPADAQTKTPEERIDAAEIEINNELRAHLLKRIVEESPAFFERLIIDLLIAMGYGAERSDAARLRGGPGDGGIDGVIDQDALGLDMVYVQAKKYKPENVVDVERIRGFAGALLGQGASKGVFVTTSRFTESARLFARNNKQQRLILIDGEELTRLMMKHNVGVRADRKVELKKIDLDYFEEEE